MAGKSVLPWLLVVLLGGFAIEGRGNPSPLRAEVQPLTLVPRSHAPAFLDITLNSQSQKPLEGTLELEAWSGRGLDFRQRIPDLTITAGVSRQRVLLPPPASAEFAEEIRLRFITSVGVHELGQFPVTTGATVERQYTIGICRVEAMGARQPFLWQALRPEGLEDPKRKFAFRVASSVVWLTPEDLPTPPGLCAFDVVVLEGPALMALGPRQLDDLAVWLEAGGSLCLILPERLDAEHVTFLNRVARSRRDATPFQLESDGTVNRVRDSGKSVFNGDSFLFCRVKLGRCVIAAAPPAREDQVAAADWPRAARFLGHLDQDVPVETKAWLFPPNEMVPGAIERRLFRSLPHPTQMIPLPVVSVILGTFVVLIGPGEWYTLGYLRRRRWTWVTFPLIAVSCAFLTVRAAEHYLGSGDQRATMVITDFAEDGRPLRENRFELWFTGRNQDGVSEKRQALSVPCRTESFLSPPSMGPTFISRGSVVFPGPWSPSVPSRAPTAPGSEFHPLYEGRVPGRYVLHYPLTQWTPYLQRTLSFAPPISEPHLQWEALRAEDIPALDLAPVLASAVSDRIGGQDWKIFAFHGRHEDTSHRGDASEVPLDYLYAGGRVLRLTLEEFLAHGLPEENGTWSRSISPSGQADSADLPLSFQYSDLLVIAERRVGQEIRIQRCLYRLQDHE